MKKLYSYFTSFSLILLCSAGAIQGMEVTVPQPQVTANQSVVPSLKQLCLNYIGQNAQQVNLMDNLAALPDDLASKAILSLDNNNLEANKEKLIELAQSQESDRSVLCAIAEKTKNIDFAFELAKSGPITDGVALVIIDNFLNSDITVCFEDSNGAFNQAFNKAFPQEILKHGNYERLYHILVNKITGGFSCVEWQENEKALFSVQDFEQNLSTKKIVKHAALKCFNNESFDNASAHGHIALSSCGTLLAFTEPHSCSGICCDSEIYNLKTGTKMKVQNSPVCIDHVIIKSIAFSKDSSHLGILGTDGNIYTFELTAKPFDNVSLQKLASWLYCNKHLINNFKLARGTKTGFGHLLFESDGMSDEEITLIELTKEILREDAKLLPACIYAVLNGYIVRLGHAETIITALDIACTQLKVTKKEAGIKWFIVQHPRFIHDFYAIITNKFDVEMLGKLNEALDCLFRYMLTFLTDPKVV